MASFLPYRLPYTGKNGSNTTVTRFSQFIACELGSSVSLSPSLLTQTFIRALFSAMFNVNTKAATEMGSNAFAQLMNANIGDKVNMLIKEVYVDDQKISPNASINPIVRGDFIVELVIRD
jgi:hypothetical protein